MRENYLERVLDMLGEPLGRYQDPEAWRELEGELGVSLPTDYKKIVDGYAPVLINKHLSLGHPATERWNLGEWMRRTADSWSQIDWDEGEPEGDPRISLGVPDLNFGTPDGLIPLASTDRGEVIFYAPRGGRGKGTLFVEDGEGEFFEYSMTFGEWLFRWLMGDEVAGSGSGAFYPGPVSLSDLPMAAGERPPTRYGPSRGM
ncbi:SMI1/KNR4 family protein [Streptomyces sp. NPDC056704]|uniref:SMI1/KNR4 family protein n=1 Tax=Streptomyces sp. NPDC056704 TaxID=3345917 RepID=UPI00369AA712